MTKKTKNLIICLIVLALVGISWLIFDKYKASSNFKENFFSEFLATLIGIIFGIPVGLWVSELQEYFLEKEKKPKILSLLYSELAHNLNYFQKYLKSDNRRYGQNIFDWNHGELTIVLKDELWNTFSDSGEIEWIKDLILLDRISSAYYQIKSYKAMYEFVSKMGPGNRAAFYQDKEDYSTLYDMLVEKSEDTINYLQEAMDLINEIMKKSYHTDFPSKIEL